MVRIELRRDFRTKRKALCWKTRSLLDVSDVHFHSGCMSGRQLCRLVNVEEEGGGDRFGRKSRHLFLVLYLSMTGPNIRIISSSEGTVSFAWTWTVVEKTEGGLLIS